MSFSRDVVLLITHSADRFTVDRVAQALSKQGVRSFRFDTDMFPMVAKITTCFDRFGSQYHLEYDGISIDSQQIRSVWMRRIWTPNFDRKLATQYKTACIRESLAALEGFWDGLQQVHWLDNLGSIQVAENKLYQLRVASEIGLIIPRTIVTNDPQQAKEFFDRVEGKAIVKLLRSLSMSMEGSSFFCYTSAVNEKDLEDLQKLRYSPILFQEQIPKQKELRVVFVGGKVFVGAIDASKYETSTVDWRNAQPETCLWQFDRLPGFIIDLLQAFMIKLKLSFGVFDFILTPDREYVFLEVNPIGEWGMLERDLDYPISSAIADLLISI